MKNKRSNASMEELTWQQARAKLAKVNPTLAKLIDNLDLSSEYTLFLARYPFGAEILKDGLLQLPNKNKELCFINEAGTPQNIREKLDYNLNSNPVSIILKNTAEIFMLFNNTTVPLYGLIYPGKLFGTWQVLNPQNAHAPRCLWNMTAGARSIFLLPKITDTIGYNKLRQAFQLNTEKSKKLLDHWELFREIANHPAFEQTWETEILFFSKKWFEHLDDPVWKEFKLHLLDLSWKNSEFFRNEFTWDLIYSALQNDRSLRPDPYIADTVRHLLAMSIGAQPGFAPAINDKAGPIQRLQQIFAEIYRTDYDPVIMQLAFLNIENPRPIYYSLEYPTTMRFSPKSREKTSKIVELYEIMRLLEKYLKDIQMNKYNVIGTPIFEAANKVAYDFFHSDSHKYTNMHPPSEIKKGDLAFKKLKRFPVNSYFLSGCIRLNFQKK